MYEMDWKPDYNFMYFGIWGSMYRREIIEDRMSEVYWHIRVWMRRVLPVIEDKILYEIED